MAEIATAEQTSGSGFDFEDKVTAFFLANLLTSRFPLEPEVGLLQKIEFQTRALGWLLDDFLFTFQDGETIRKVAVSSKRNRQITATGLPTAILNDLWDQYLGITKEVFDPSTDLIMFIVSPLGRSVSTNLSKLIQAARVSDPADLVARLKTKNYSVAQQKLFKSFECPQEWKETHNITEEDICRLLSRIIVKEFDFNSNASTDTTLTIGILQDCLHSKNAAEAVQLYQKLCSLRMKYAQFNGYVDYSVLTKELIRQFRLSGFATHDADWRQVSQLSLQKTQNIADSAGGSLHFDRSEELSKISKILDKRQVLFLTGTSGSGKTVLAKLMHNKVLEEGGKVIWIDPEILQQGTLQNYFGIGHTLKELMGKSLGANDLLIIDGADRVYKPIYFDPLVSLIREAINTESENWHVLITCQQDDYEDLVKKLRRNNLIILDADFSPISPISNQDALKVVQAYPAFGELLKHDHLWPLLENLKFLDIVLSHLSSFSPEQFEHGIGETQLIDWIWKQEVLNSSDNGDANARFLLRLSEIQANELQLFTPKTDFDVAQSAPITEMRRLKIINDNEDRLFFAHDLFGDWARYKIIRANQGKIYTFIPTLDLFSPLWGKAIRLYGIYLLEKEHGTSQWLETYRGFEKVPENGQLIQHLLLEAIIFSNDTAQYLSELWDEFIKDEAKILNAFLERFLFKATVPNAIVLKLEGQLQGISASQLATYHRIPKFAYWFPVMETIESHFEEFMEVVRPHAIKIAEMWLDNMPVGAAFRPLAARMALCIANYMAAFKANGGFAMDHVGKEFFKPILLAAPELPAEVIALCLKLSGRIGEPKAKDRSGMLMAYNPRLGFEFADGPKVRGDRDFEEAVLEGRNLVPLIRQDAAAAREILLAIMIDAPQDLATMDRYDFKFDIKDVSNWYPPFYSRGPFLAFLQVSPFEGLDFVIRLLNLTVETWRKFRRHHKEEETAVTLILADGQKRTFYGDHDVYLWYRDIGNAPDSLVSILMALEKFLIDTIDKGQEVTAIMQEVLETSESLALLGVLSSVGRYAPNLFLSVLAPLLRVVEFYEWENILDSGVRGFEGFQMMGASLFDSTTLQLAQQWNSMPHRKRSIKLTALSLLLSEPENEAFFKREILPAWISQNQNIKEQGYTYQMLEELIAQFDPENYAPFQVESHTGVIYNEPKELTERLTEVRSAPEPDHDDFLFAFSKDRELEQKKEYNLAELLALWDRVKGFFAKPEGNMYDNLNQRIANIFSGLEILLRYPDFYKNSHPEILAWTLERVGEVLDKFVFNLHSATMMSGPGNWKKFCQRIILNFFAADQASITNRKFIGIMVLHGDNESVSQLFSGLMGSFRLDHPVVIQLTNLFIRRSAVIERQEFSGWDNPTDWKTEFSPLLEDYINDQIPKEPEAFSDFLPEMNEENYEDEYGFTRQRFGHNLEPKETGLDLQFVYQPFAFPQWEDITGENQKTYVLDCYKRLIGLLTYTWGEITEQPKAVEIDFRDFDYWLLERLGVLMPKLSEDQSRQLWEPLFSYGNIAGKWLKSFIDNLLTKNHHLPEHYAATGLIWNQMISYAKEAATWKPGGFNRWDHVELWDTLMGFSNTAMSIWQWGAVDLLLSVRDKLLFWLIRRYTYTEGVNKMAIILRSPSALNFLSIGILILDSHLKYQAEVDKMDTPDGMHRVKFQYYDSIANAASYLWQHHRMELTGNENTFKAYKSIVLHLVAVQNLIGLELQDRLIES